METNEKIRRIAKKFMGQQGINTEQLAKETGMGASTIRNFLDGRRNASIVSAEKILDALGLEIGVKRKETNTCAEGT